MVSRAVRQADQRDENRQDADRDASHGLRKKTRGPGHRPTEHDYRGRVHRNTIFQQRFQTLRR
jgi:hypothetical protein